MDITSMSPVTGRLVKEDGSTFNVADALSDGSEAVTSGKVPIHAMSPRTGPKGTAHSSSDATIRSTYKQIGIIPAAAAGNNVDWWVGDCGFDIDTGSWYPSAEGASSSQGYGDRCYAGGTSSTSGIREYLQGGVLWRGSDAGSAFLNCEFWLDGGTWDFLACD